MALGSPRRLSWVARFAQGVRDACLRRAASTTQATEVIACAPHCPTASLYTHMSLMPAGLCFKHELLR